MMQAPLAVYLQMDKSDRRITEVFPRSADIGIRVLIPANRVEGISERSFASVSARRSDGRWELVLDDSTIVTVKYLRYLRYQQLQQAQVVVFIRRPKIH